MLRQHADSFIQSNISAVDLNLDLAHMTGLTDDPLPGTSGAGAAAVVAAASRACRMPTISECSASLANGALLTGNSEWPDNLLDLDFLKTEDLMAISFEGHEVAAAVAEVLAPPLQPPAAPPALPSATPALPVREPPQPLRRPSLEAMYQPRIVQVTNFQTGERDYEEDVTEVPAATSFSRTVAPTGVSRQSPHVIKQEPTDEPPAPDEDEDYDSKYTCSAGLLRRNPAKHRQPWLADEPTEKSDTAMTTDGTTGGPISAYEEAEMLRKLRHCMRNSDRHETAATPAWVRRLHRKLCVRELKRTLGRVMFNIDEQLLLAGQASAQLDSYRGGNGRTTVQVLDRYHQLVCVGGRVKRETAARLAAGDGGGHEMFVSPHTGRVLHPFVYRNTEQMPQWVKVSGVARYGSVIYTKRFESSGVHIAFRSRKSSRIFDS